MAKSKVTFNIPLALSVADAAGERGIRAATLEIHKIVVEDILGPNPPRSGLTYARGKSKTHTASAEGESPASDYGTLVASVQPEFIADETGIPLGVVYSPLTQALALQQGTERVKPRPWLSRIITDKGFHDRIVARFTKAARRGLPK